MRSEPLPLVTIDTRYSSRAAKRASKNPYLAKIIGREKGREGPFKREFLARPADFDAADVPALIQRRNVDRRGQYEEAEYILLLPAADDQLTHETVEKPDAMWLAAQMQSGRSLVECWDGARVTAKEATRRRFAVTLQSAIDRCVQFLSPLPFRERRKAIRLIKTTLANAEE